MLSQVHTNSAVIMGVSSLFVEHNEVEQVDEGSADDVGEDNLPVEGDILLDGDVCVEGGEEAENVGTIVLESGLDRREEAVMVKSL